MIVHSSGHVAQFLSDASNESPSRHKICPGKILKVPADPCWVSELRSAAVQVSWSVVTVSAALHAG